MYLIISQELDNRGYICPQCHKSYSPMEVDRVMDYVRGMFICEDCGAELVDNEDAESVRGNQDRMQRFNRQMSFIREGLRKSEAMVLPAYVIPARYFLISADIV
jgi:transcription initiation factor TFIIE subunit alpha